MPDGFRHVAWGDLDAMRAAVDGTRRCGADRADPGRRRGPSGHRRVPAGHPRAVRRDRCADDRRRDPDRLRPHRTLVRVRARRREPRRRHARQGDGQRDAGRCLLGPGRRRRRVPARRPRQHLLGHGDRRPQRSTPSSTRCSASTHQRWPNGRGSGSSTALRGDSRRGRRARPWPDARRRARRRASTRRPSTATCSGSA